MTVEDEVTCYNISVLAPHLEVQGDAGERGIFSEGHRHTGVRVVPLQTLLPGFMAESFIHVYENFETDELHDLVIA